MKDKTIATPETVDDAAAKGSRVQAIVRKSVKAKLVNLESSCPFCGIGYGPDEHFLLCDVSDMLWPNEYGYQQTVRQWLGVSRAYAVHCENCGAWGPVKTSQDRAMRDWEKV